MALVPAICTQCGGKILVDDTRDAGICEYCGTAFVTEKVINNYQSTINVENATINVTGVGLENLLLRAKSFEENNNRDEAIKYYNKVLDIDINNESANEGLKRLSTRYIGIIPVSDSVCDEIESLMAKGEKINAIKRVREETGWGLADAKQFIDNHKEGDWEAKDMGFQVKKDGGCYVATAVYGSYDCPQVWTLRRYRDNILAETWYGRAFIRTYYAISPTLVKMFGDNAWFKNILKPKLDRMVKELNRIGVEDTPYQDRNW